MSETSLSYGHSDMESVPHPQNKLCAPDAIHYLILHSGKKNSHWAYIKMLKGSHSFHTKHYLLKSYTKFLALCHSVTILSSSCPTITNQCFSSQSE